MNTTVMVWRSIISSASIPLIVVFSILFLLFTFCLSQLNPFWCFITGSAYFSVIITLMINAPYTNMKEKYDQSYDFKTIINAKISLILITWVICVILEGVIYNIFTIPELKAEDAVIQNFDFEIQMLILFASALPFLAISYLSTYVSYVSRIKYSPKVNLITILFMFIPFYPAVAYSEPGTYCYLNVDSTVIVISIISIILSIVLSIYLVKKLYCIEINEYDELIK